MTTEQPISTILDQTSQIATPDTATKVDDPRVLVQAFQQRLRAELLSTAAEKTARPARGRWALIACQGIAARVDSWLTLRQPDLTPAAVLVDA